MTSRQLSRLAIGMAILTLTAVLLFDGSTRSAAAGKGSAPTAPGNLVVTAITETTVSLSWRPSTNSKKFSYNLRITNLNNSAYNTSVSIGQTQTTFTATFLASNNNYTFVMNAIDSSSGAKSADSNTASARTLADTTPPGTPVLNATVLNPSQVQLTWNKTTDNIPNNCCVFSFTMNGSSLTQNINWASAPAGKNSVIIRHIKPGTTNSFSVNVGDYSGNFAASNTVFATTPPSSDVTPPTVPASVHLVDTLGSCELYIGWTQASDNTDPQANIEYEIYVNGALSPLPVSAGVDVDFVYAFMGDNTITVKAVDRSGNSSAASSPFNLFIPGC